MGLVLLRRIAIAATVLVGLLAAAWFWGLPRYRPEISGNQMFGIDISSAQGAVDWSLVPSSDIGFAYLQATDGSVADPQFLANRDGAIAAGIRPGPYHVFSACSSGGEQAAAFVAVAAPDVDQLPPAIVLTDEAECLRQQSPEQVFLEVEAFVAAVELAHDRPVVVYERDRFDYLDALTDERRQWRRSLFRGPVEAEWSLWQFHNRARIEGVDGPVNLNIANIDQLRD